MSGLELTLLRPLWLLALIPLAGVAVWVWRKSGGLGDWRRATDPALMQAMRELGRVETRRSAPPMLAALVLLGLIVLALSGPAIERRDSQSYRNLDGVLFLFDVSPSVIDDPAWPDVLATGRFAVASLGSRPAGLIVFAGDAYVATDMTADHLQLGQTLSLLDEAQVPDPGSRPAAALRLAAQILADAQVVAGDVVLFSDGAGLGPETLQAAAAIAAQGTRLSLVAMHDQAAPFQTHAAAGGGAVFGPEDAEALGLWLQQDARTRLERQDYPLLFWQDLGRYLLALALLPALLMFRRDTA